MDQKQQELIFKLSLYEQQIQQMQQQQDAVERGLQELILLSKDIDELKNSKNKEIFASIGKGIFIKSKIISEDLIVDIGNKNFVKKSVQETKELIEKQVNNLKNILKELEKSIKQINKELMNLIDEAQRYEQESHGHKHDNSCEHEH